MKTSNIQTTHAPAIIKGWVRGISASSIADVAGLEWVVMTPTQLAANTNDWAPVDATDTTIDLDAASIIRASTSASWNLTGLTAPNPADEVLKVLENVGTLNLVLVHNATSTAANRFDCGGDVNVTIPPDGSAFLLYDSISSRWRVVALGTGSGGGSGTGTPGWFNVRAYGATGNGTTNDVAAFTAADAAATAAGHGVVYCPPGSYVLGSAFALNPSNSLIGDGRENTFVLAGANSINVVTITGTAIDSAYEVAHASTITGIEFGANSKTGCEGIALIGVAYWTINRCTVRGFTTGIDAYGSLQGLVFDSKVLSNATGIKYSAQTIGYYGGTLPPNRVMVGWSTFYYNTTHAIDFSGGQQCILESSEFGVNGTAANAGTSAIKVSVAGDSHGPGLIGKNLWLETNHGLATVELTGTGIAEHSLTDCWLAYGDATYSVTVDGSTAAQTLNVTNTHHDKVGSPATVDTFRSQGGTTYLNAKDSNGSTSGTWTAVRQEPLLSEQLVSDLSQWLALRLPNVTTTQRDAIASPTAGMLVWNTTTASVQKYSGAAWADVSGGSGTVTSVALTVPAEFSVSGSPITTSGTLAITSATEAANTVWAGPTSGAAATPAFRALALGDMPVGSTPDHEHIGNVQFNGDGVTTAFELPAAPFDAYSVEAFVAGVLQDVTLSGTMLTTMTFLSAPASGTNNIQAYITAAVS